MRIKYWCLHSCLYVYSGSPSVTFVFPCLTAVYLAGNDPGAGPSWAVFADERHTRLARPGDWGQRRSLTPLPASVPSPDSDVITSDLDSLFSFINRTNGPDNCTPPPPVDMPRPNSVSDLPTDVQDIANSGEAENATVADRSGGGVSDSGSDCLITGYEKPYESRTPIPISSDEASLPDQPIVSTTKGRRSSDESVSGPSSQQIENKQPRRKVQWLPFKKRRPTEVIEVSSDSDSYVPRQPSRNRVSAASSATFSSPRDNDSDGDVIITSFSPAERRHRHLKKKKKKKEKKRKRQRSRDEEPLRSLAKSRSSSTNSALWQDTFSVASEHSPDDSTRPTCSYQRRPFLPSIMPPRMRCGSPPDLSSELQEDTPTSPTSSSSNIGTALASIVTKVDHKFSVAPRRLDIVTTSDAEEAAGPPEHRSRMRSLSPSRSRTDSTFLPDPKSEAVDWPCDSGDAGHETAEKELLGPTGLPLLALSPRATVGSGTLVSDFSSCATDAQVEDGDNAFVATRLCSLSPPQLQPQLRQDTSSTDSD